MQKRKILVLFAHPRSENQGVNVRMAEAARTIPGVTVVDLYAEYPRFDIDVDREQERLVAHDVVVFQHPMFWYSTPAILKEWQDLVLEYGFAYGSQGRALEGKLFLSAVTTGGDREAYTTAGYQHFPVHELLRPIEQTACLCHMVWLPPLVLYAAGHAEEEGRLAPHIARYRGLLEDLRDHRLDPTAAARYDLMGDYLDTHRTEAR